jgi:hypothetical protein
MRFGESKIPGSTVLVAPGGGLSREARVFELAGTIHSVGPHAFALFAKGWAAVGIEFLLGQDDSRLILFKSGNERALSATSSPRLATTQERAALNRNSAHRKSQRVGTRSRASPTHSLQNEGWGTLCPGGSRRSRTKGWATLPESQSGEVHYEIKMEALHYSFSGIRPTCLVGDSAAICATR